MITIEEQMEDYELLGYIFAECKECREEVKVEPDAETGWCEYCDEVVEVENHLINMGMI